MKVMVTIIIAMVLVMVSGDKTAYKQKPINENVSKAIVVCYYYHLIFFIFHIVVVGCL